jgi:hypothetical protein
VTIIEPGLRTCDQCGTFFTPRSGTGGSPQRFCGVLCRLSFHTEGQRGQRRPASSVLDVPPPDLLQPAAERQVWGAEKGFVLMGQQDVIEVTWDRQGTLLLRQKASRHGLRISRDYFPQFVGALDVLREVIVDSIKKGRAK